MHIESRATRAPGSKGFRKIIATPELQEKREAAMEKAEKPVKYKPYILGGTAVGAGIGAAGLAALSKIRKIPGTGKLALLGALFGGGYGALSGANTASVVVYADDEKVVTKVLSVTVSGTPSDANIQIDDLGNRITGAFAGTDTH